MTITGRSGRGNPNRPQRLVINRLYEQFKPMSEWRQDGYDTLLVYLPGFQKECIRITTEDLNVVRVRGERLVSENKWSRFQEDYRVPGKCEMSGIHARFEGGILKITMPRKINNAPKTKEPPRKPKGGLNEKKPDKHQMACLDSLRPQLKQTSSLAPTKQQTKPAAEEKEAMKLEHDDVEKRSVGEKTDLGEGKGKAILKETKGGFEGTKRKLKYSGVASSGLQGVVARRGMVNEDRKLLVNVGVRVLMIAALGVHVSCSIGLFGEGK